MKIDSLVRHINWFALVFASAAAVSTDPAMAKGEISEIFTERRAATSLDYAHEGISYRWGNGDDLVITGFTYQGEKYDYQQFADRVEMKRVDNPLASGERCSVFAETSGSALNYAPSYPKTRNELGNCDMGKIISGNVINVGVLDVFSNAGFKRGSIKNIERVDFILDDGLLTQETTETLASSGQVVIEKAGNNPLKIAAITSLDDNGEPASYGKLVTINPNWHSAATELRYGLTNVSLSLDFLANEDTANPGRISYQDSRYETLGMVFVSQADMGLATEQRYYGFSIFPADVESAIHNLTDPRTFPKNSADTHDLDPGDADFFAAFAIKGGLPEENNPPVAEDDYLFVEAGNTSSINLLANDSDPDGDSLTATLLTEPTKGTATIENGVFIFAAGESATGQEQLSYQISDGQGGEDTAIITISIPAVLPSASGRIATGLQGHGAGSLDIGFLILIGGLMMRRKRKSAIRP